MTRNKPGFAAIVLLAALTLGAFIGCSTTDNDGGVDLTSENSRLSLVAKPAVYYTVAEFVDGDGDRAERVMQYTDVALELVEGNEVATLAILAEVLKAQIDYSKLTPAQTVLVNALIDAVQSAIEERIDTGILDAGDHIEIATVLQWVQDAAILGLEPPNG